MASLLLEAGRQRAPAQIEDGEQSAHDRRRSRDNDPGDDSGFAVRIALGDGIGSAPDFEDAPNEAEHEHDAERRAETLLKRGRRAGAGRLGEEDGGEDRMSAKRERRGSEFSSEAGQCGRSGGYHTDYFTIFPSCFLSG